MNNNINIIIEWRDLFKSMGYNVIELPLRYGGPYDVKVGGYHVILEKPMGTGSIVFISVQPYLSNAFEDLLEQIYTLEKTRARRQQDSHGAF